MDTAQNASTAKLFTPLRVGNLTLSHRVVMSPLTRTRAPGGIPDDMVAEYYSQRATPGGLIISEGTHPSYMAGNYHHVPGIYTPEHIRAWRKVTDVVHAKGGYMFCQLWHTGRATVSTNLGGRLPLSSSATKLDFTNRFTAQGPVPCGVPKPMTLDDIQDTIDDHVHAAKCAILAGFDGVEIQGANGYLLDQFLCDNINRRTDDYGGSVENRARLTLEVLEAVSRAVGPSRTAIRFSPFGLFQDTAISDPVETFSYVLDKVDKLGLAYVSLTEPRADLLMKETEKMARLFEAARARGIADEALKNLFSLQIFRPILKNTVFFGNGGFDATNCFQPVENGQIDGVIFGRLFISNPDLVERLKLDKPMDAIKWPSVYAHTADGYTDYLRHDGRSALDDGVVPMKSVI